MTCYCDASRATPLEREVVGTGVRFATVTPLDTTLLSEQWTHSGCAAELAFQYEECSTGVALAHASRLLYTLRAISMHAAGRVTHIFAREDFARSLRRRGPALAPPCSTGDPEVMNFAYSSINDLDRPTAPWARTRVPLKLPTSHAPWLGAPQACIVSYKAKR